MRARQQASQKAAEEKEAREKEEIEPRFLGLILSDFVLCHSLEGWEFDDLEPRYRVAVRAKWRHWNGSPRSEKIFVRGREIDPETTPIWFTGVGSSKTETDKSHADHRALDVRLTDAVFEQLVNTVQHGQITEAWLSASTEPRADLPPRLLVRDLNITSQPQMVAPPAEVERLARRINNFLNFVPILVVIFLVWWFFGSLIEGLFLALVGWLINLKKSDAVEGAEFVAVFGGPVVLISVVWRLIKQRSPEISLQNHIGALILSWFLLVIAGLGIAVFITTGHL